MPEQPARMYRSLAEASTYARYVSARYLAAEASAFGTPDEAARADALVAEARAAWLAECAAGGAHTSAAVDAQS